VGHTAEFVVRHGYALLFVWLLAEQGALPLPSVPLLLACGALARNGQLNPFLVLLSGMAACLLADNIWFQLGRRRGARILKFLCRIALEPDSCVRRTETAFEKYGVRSLLVAKFVPGLNAVAAPMAGESGPPIELRVAAIGPFKFPAAAGPGSVLEARARVVGRLGGLFKIEGTVTADGVLVASGSLTLAG